MWWTVLLIRRASSLKRLFERLINIVIKDWCDKEINRKRFGITEFALITRGVRKISPRDEGIWAATGDPEISAAFGIAASGSWLADASRTAPCSKNLLIALWRLAPREEIRPPSRLRHLIVVLPIPPPPQMYATWKITPKGPPPSFAIYRISSRFKRRKGKRKSTRRLSFRPLLIPFILKHQDGDG